MSLSIRPLIFKTFTGCLIATSCLAGNAQTLAGLVDDFRKASAEGRTAHVVDIDNDTLLLNRDDGFYSSRVRYTQSYSMHEGGSFRTYGWRIGQELYTASDIKLPPELVVPPDHPYAGWLYGGLFRHQQHVDGSHLRLGVDIGCLGPCAGGRRTQKTFHQLLDQPLPQGWSRQVRNEFGVVLHADYSPGRWAPTTGFDITPSIKARFGNIFTDLGAGLLLRAGALNLLPDQPAFYAFLRTDARLVGHNATLQGGYFSNNNPHTVEPERRVGEVEAGLAWQRAPYGIKASVVRRSNEIRDLRDSAGAQNFVRLQFSYAP